MIKLGQRVYFILKKSSISPNLIKFLTYSVMALILTTVVSILTSRIMDKFIERTSKEYNDDYKAILSGYAQSVSISLNSYKDMLNIISNDCDFSTASEIEIQNQIKSCKGKINSNFLSIIYIDLDGAGYNDIDETVDYKLCNFYYKDKSDVRSFIVGEAFYSKIGNGEFAVFPVSIPVFNNQGVIKGTLSAFVSIDYLSQIFAVNTIQTKGSVTVMDGTGKFVYTKNQKNMMKNPEIALSDFVDSNEMDLSQLSDFVHLSGTKNDVRDYDYFVKQVPLTDWIVIVSAPTALRNELKNELVLAKIAITFIVILLIMMLSLIEMHVLEILQKKQMIATVYDSLTGLSTRQHFENEATKLLKRHPNAIFMVVDVDIRGFKFINQKYGEKEADDLLVFFSKILNEECDKRKGLIGRGSSDHFNMIFRIVSVEKALNDFEENMPGFIEKLKNYKISFFPSFGISFYTGKIAKRATIHSLIGQALFAKTSNKDNVMNFYSVYDLNLVEKVKEEIYFEENMEDALEKGEFFVMYQPKIELKTEKIGGAEALVRWNSPKLGFVGPDKFIPIFEKNGFITKLDFFVYEQVFKFQQKCIDEGLPTVKVSVNMSRCHADPEKFLKDFLTLFHKYTIPPSLIEIEILERSLMNSMDLSTTVNMLHKEGFSVAMDDFGSGESSLNMLTKIPVDVLKFDKEFLSASRNDDSKLDEQAKSFIETLVNLGLNLKKQTVFEGVETETQRDFLKSIKCDLVQGYFYSRPLFQPDFVDFMKRYSTNKN